MHPAIFGVVLGVPTLLVTEAYKATAMFDGLGLGGAVAGAHAEAPARLAEPRAPDATLARERCALNDTAMRRLLAAGGF